MRLLLASLFVIAIQVAFIALASFLGWDRVLEPFLWLVMPVLFLGAVGAAMRLFNGPNLAPRDQIREWEEQGLLVSTDFRARRAFQVEEYEDEGPHYVLELEDGSVLYLNGQYLYDYEAIEDDDPEFHQPRRFPCTEFTVRRHRDKGYVVDLDCRGTVLEPEEVQPAFTTAEYRSFDLGDGELIRDRTYEEVKSRRTQASRSF